MHNGWIMKLLLAAVAVLVGSVTPAFRLDAGVQLNPPAQIAVRVDLVALDIEVLDALGEPVTGLQRNDFTVREGGIPREISSFAWVSGQPISLTAILDTGAATPDDFSIAKESVVLLAHLLAREDEVCLYSYDYRDAYMEQEFTSDRPRLVQAMENVGVIPRKKASFLRNLFGTPPRAGLSIDAALLNASRGKNQRKALILVSHSLQGLGQATLDHVLESGVPVFLLSIAGEEKNRPATDQGESGLRQIVAESGGREFLADRATMTRVCRSIACALKNYYTITYATEIGSPDQAPRRIEVAVRGQDHIIHARRSYTPAP
jgi:VWFA-related protein